MVSTPSILRLFAIASLCSLTSTLPADQVEPLDRIATILSDHCFDCHNNDNAEARVNLEELVANPDPMTRFRTWEKVSEMVRRQQMPPRDASELDDNHRSQVVEAISAQLHRTATKHNGDPGRVVMRRLTAAEYRYTVQDLTGLQLDLDAVLIGDAAGGEGFTNVGDVQFLQESTLERYLEAAKLVASHAVIGSGPLQFFESPGKTGLELSGIHRIHEIYRRYGFRSAAGEGGEPFGLDLLPRAFFAAWKFQHRRSLGLADATIEELAREERISPPFVHHVWTTFHREAPSFPLSEVSSAWHDLPRPAAQTESDLDAVRQQCEDVAALMQDWQTRLSSSVGDDEEAALLTGSSIRLTQSSQFRASLDWTEGVNQASVYFITAPATQQRIDDTLVVWRDPKIQFRFENRSRAGPVSLSSIVTDTQRPLFGRGDSLVNDAEDVDLVLAGPSETQVNFEVPAGAIAARLWVTAELHVQAAPNAIVRCTVRDGAAEGDTAADTGEVSAVLGPSSGDAFEAWRDGVLEFAAALPDVSHREPTPSDRDPIPAPYDGRYNTAERNEFHYTIKYHRDDDFLVKYLLEEPVREQLDQAWTDLLLSFDYHKTFLSFIARKAGADQPESDAENLEVDLLDRLPNDYRMIAQRLVDEHARLTELTRAAQGSHVDGVVEFARAAWRRPLVDEERRRVRAFYREMVENQSLSHEDAIRATIVRVLISPAFLYRVERQEQSSGVVRLTQSELASRLSYFLWSSPPDEELASVAEQGSLDDDQLKQQTMRMLRDPRSRRLATEFFGQWFGFYQFDEFRGIDMERFPGFEDLKSSMYEEAILFFQHFVTSDRPLDEILFADYGFWNEQLAKHYGLPQARLNKLTEHVHLVHDIGSLHRGGLLGLGVIHATTSAPLRTSAVKRGDWILRRVLGTPVPPPPADAGSIAADDVSGDGKTVRERLIAHRRSEACVNCHSRMDPLGFAMENFDPIGQWRDTYRDGRAIDASGTLNDGFHINGLAGLEDYLREQLPKFHRTLCSKLVGYALGRSEILSDRLLIDEMMTDLKEGAPFSTVASRVVTSRQFRTKRGGIHTEQLKDSSNVVR